MRHILQRPLVTEKASALNEQQMYGFIVANSANKIEIKKAVEKLFNVSVAHVNTMRYAGKKVTRYTKHRVMHGKRPAYKKAIVTLRKGEVLDIYQDAQ